MASKVNSSKAQEKYLQHTLRSGVPLTIYCASFLILYTIIANLVSSYLVLLVSNIVLCGTYEPST